MTVKLLSKLNKAINFGKWSWFSSAPFKSTCWSVYKILRRSQLLCILSDVALSAQRLLLLNEVNSVESCEYVGVTNKSDPWSLSLISFDLVVDLPPVVYIALSHSGV